MEARFEHRLKMVFAIDEDARQALVPQLLLQPLVENSIRHGMNQRFEARIEVAARQTGSALTLTVRDHGQGFSPTGESATGIGLRNTRERLNRLYRNQQRMELRNASDGGALVVIQLPFQLIPEQDTPAANMVPVNDETAS
jgi:two-component system, LytTR family, sensor kinase